MSGPDVHQAQAGDDLEQLKAAFFDFIPSRQYSRNAAYDAMDGEAHGNANKINDLIEPFVRWMYSCFYIGIFGMAASIVIGLTWIYYLSPLLFGDAQTPLSQMFNHVSTCFFALTVPIGLIIYLIVQGTLMTTFRFRIMELKVRHTIHYRVLYKLYRDMMEAYGKFTRDNAEFSSYGLMNLIGVRVKNILYHRQIWLIPIITRIRFMRFRLEFYSIAFGIGAIIFCSYVSFQTAKYLTLKGMTAQNLYIVETYDRATKQKVESAVDPATVDEALYGFEFKKPSAKYKNWPHALISKSPFANILTLILFLMSFSVFLTGRIMGFRIHKKLAALLDLDKYNHWSVRELLKQGGTQALTRDDYEETVDPKTYFENTSHDLTAFIVEHYYQNMKQLIKFKERGGINLSKE